MIQVSEIRYNGLMKICRIHDLLHDLAKQKAQDDNFLRVCSQIADVQYCRLTRRLAIHDVSWYRNYESQEAKKAAMAEVEELYGQSLSTAPNLRSIFCTSRLIPNISQLLHLKVLDYQHYYNCTHHFEFEPKKFRRLSQLRYIRCFLKVASEDENNFQKWMSGMRFLQTLDLGTGGIPGAGLPDCTWHVKTLRHVSLPKWSPGPPASAELINLQTLEGVESRESWGAAGSALPNMPNLRRLGIRSCDRFQWNTIRALLGTLEHLIHLTIVGEDVPLNIIDMRGFPFYHRLQSLSLGEETSCPTKIDLDVLMFPDHLTVLTLKGLNLETDPMPVLEKMKCMRWLWLQKLKIKQIMCCSAGGFSQLEELCLWDLNEVEEWKIVEGAMPMLKTLRVLHCDSLHVPIGLQNLTVLQQLYWSNSDDHKMSKTKENEIREVCKHVPSIRTDIESD